MNTSFNSTERNSRSIVLGFPVDSFTMPEAVGRIQDCLAGGKFHHVVAINANKIWLCERNAALNEIVRRAEVVIPEWAVVWAARVLRRPLRGHIGGVMLLKALFPFLERKGTRCYFLGAKPEVLELLRARLLMQYPNLKISGMRSGYFELDQENFIVDSINETGTEILFVAMGTPRQELFIERHRNRLKAKVAMGVGGSFDVVAGIKKDAPDWTRHGAEWIYRLVQDPKNLWKRYLKTNPWFVYRVLRERVVANR